MTMEALKAAAVNPTNESALRRHKTGVVLCQVADEVERQHELWGQQDWADGTDDRERSIADYFKRWNDELVKTANISWSNILNEEVCEALCEEDEAKLRDELVQVAAVAVSWIKAIDRRTS